MYDIGMGNIMVLVIQCLLYVYQVYIDLFTFYYIVSYCYSCLS